MQLEAIEPRLRVTLEPNANLVANEIGLVDDDTPPPEFASATTSLTSSIQSPSCAASKSSANATRFDSR